MRRRSIARHAVTDAMGALEIRKRFKVGRLDMTVRSDRKLKAEGHRMTNVLTMHEEGTLVPELEKYRCVLEAKGCPVGIMCRNAVVSCLADVGDFENAYKTVEGAVKDSYTYSGLIKAASRLQDDCQTSILMWEEALLNGVKPSSGMYGAILATLSTVPSQADRFRSIFNAFLLNSDGPKEAHYAMWISMYDSVPAAVEEVLPLIRKHNISLTKVTLQALLKLSRVTRNTNIDIIFSLPEVQNGVAKLSEKEYTIAMSVFKDIGDLKQVETIFNLLKKNVARVVSAYPYVLYLKAVERHLTDSHVTGEAVASLVQTSEQLFEDALVAPTIPTHHPWTALFKIYSRVSDTGRAAALLARLQRETTFAWPFPLREAIGYNSIQLPKKFEKKTSGLQTWHASAAKNNNVFSQRRSE
eukprot:TRINITY_DN18404_c0_g1_i1.p1 TRINITY_DN18404_c0_g1~~TRINITY_DN18404_c0_g1_i1.p1  ORF type:complete len:428 (+),score=73.74 TRINITY_DN18404_c0_g1_i1:46-1284(+)